MRKGYQLASNREATPTDEERSIIYSVVRDCYTNAIGEWMAYQKPKIRTKFTNFMIAVREAPTPPNYNASSSDVAERFAKDIFQHRYHPVLRNVIDESNGEYSDVIHLLSIHMSRANVMASITQKRDETPKLLKAIAQEDHILNHPQKYRHENPPAIAAKVLTRSNMNDPILLSSPSKICKPAREGRTPFATFPTNEPIESTNRSDYRYFEGMYKRNQRSGVCNFLNSPTCL
ncbi:hypothetical protein M9Y10_021928 [Tritrichomonas musculus]|uniref:Uncharacterized protein n=1 Tax=Tritrichomonas musculus TaxID=1915356 RepID=A0ABR2KRR2_9EUKA